MLPPVELDRLSKAQSLQDPVGCQILTCKKPGPTKRKTDCKISTKHHVIYLNRKTDMAWVIECFDFKKDETVNMKPSASGTCGAFNSLF